MASGIADRRGQRVLRALRVAGLEVKPVSDYDEDYFASKSLGWYAGRALAGVVLLVVVVGAVSFVLGWFGEARRQISPTNVRAQWQFAYDYDRSHLSVSPCDFHAQVNRV